MGEESYNRHKDADKPEVQPTLFGLRSVRTSPPRLVSDGTSSAARIAGW